MITPETVIGRSERLRDNLNDLIRRESRRGVSVEAVVTFHEINDQHGTGPLVKRVLRGRRNIFSIRSHSDWGGHDFGDWNVTLPQQGLSRAESVQSVSRVLAGFTVKTVLCVPFLEEELITSIAIQEAFGSRLCLYLMDDQNVAAGRIPDAIMQEFLEKCCLRLTTHPEMRRAYETKFGLPFFLLPAVVPDHLIAHQPVEPTYDRGAREGALIGSFWDQSWFDRLCVALKRCRYKIDWYGNNYSPFFRFPARTLARAGITPFGVVSEKRLASELRRYSFVIVPAGALDGAEMNTGVARLSLPGRILFAAATSHTPILVVGSEETCGARFVKHFGIGVTVPYDGAKLARAMDHLSDSHVQREMRAKAAALAPSLSDRGVVEWLAASIAQGRPADERFENLFAGYRF